MNTDKHPVISTTNGLVRGVERIGIYGDQYYCFDGIPYAKPPIGELRFKAPVALDGKWQGIRDCVTTATKCMQWNKYKLIKEGSEDCLYLNIYAKKLKSPVPLPVIVYIHGGGHNTGDSSRHSWGPDYFMMQDVVFITIAFRLGPFGFMSFSDPSLNVSGNAGLKDQLLALQWIKKNCTYFNGDPENITLMGHSSGASSTHILMLAPQCRGLFHKAILMSGHCLSMQDLPNLPYRLAGKLGYTGENIDKYVYEFLMQLEAHKLIGCQLLTQEELDRFHYYTFMASIEKYDSPNAIITKEPIEMLRTAWGNEIPLLMGATSFECIGHYKNFTNNNEIYERLRRHPEYFLPFELQKKCNSEMEKKLGRDLMISFLGDNWQKAMKMENIFKILDINSYGFMYHSLHRVLLSRMAHASAATYLYRFDFDSPEFNLYRLRTYDASVRGVGHVDDLSYIFVQPLSYKLAEESPEYQTIIRMITLFTNFATKSDPNGDIIKPIVWKPVEPNERRKCLNISYTLEFMDSPEQAKSELIDRLYESAGLDIC